MDDDAIAFADETYRRRAQALASADEMIAHLFQILEDAQQLEDTVVMFSSDHGYHVGNHRLPAGKSLPYREDTHVPFAIRGPGIPKGMLSTYNHRNGTTDFSQVNKLTSPPIISILHLRCWSSQASTPNNGPSFLMDGVSSLTGRKRIIQSTQLQR